MIMPYLLQFRPVNCMLVPKNEWVDKYKNTSYDWVGGCEMWVNMVLVARSAHVCHIDENSKWVICLMFL